MKATKKTLKSILEGMDEKKACDMLKYAVNMMNEKYGETSEREEDATETKSIYLVFSRMIEAIRSGASGGCEDYLVTCDARSVAGSSPELASIFIFDKHSGKAAESLDRFSVSDVASMEIDQLMLAGRGDFTLADMMWWLLAMGKRE